jgi:hypothetical protein
MYFLRKPNLIHIDFHLNMEGYYVGLEGHLSNNVIVFMYSHYRIIFSIDVKYIVLLVGESC